MRVVMYAFDHIEYTLQLAEALSHLVELIVIMPEDKLKPFENVVKGVEIEKYYQPRLRYPTNLFSLYLVLRRIREFKPDILHLQGEHPWLNLSLPILSKKYPIVTTVHDVVPHVGDMASQRIPDFVYRLSARYSKAIIVHGDKLRREMVRKFKRPAESIYVVPRGINSIYCRLDVEVNEEEGSVLFFGRVWEYKGLRYLIEAEPMITEKIPECKIVIAGKGENLEKYLRMMVHRERFVIFDQSIPNKLVAELFQKASLVVLPYIEASQSGIIPLAYAFKKPVVATSVGSIPEVVEHGKTGYLVPPRDARSLAEAIIELLSDREKRRRMGENAFKKGQNELAWDTIAQKTVAVYDKALRDKRNE